MAYFLGVDTGGTYTDAVIVDEAADRVIGSAKSLTTRGDLALGIGRAVDAALSGAGVAPREVRLVSLSTTLATNALVEGQGGRVALIFIGLPFVVRTVQPVLADVEKELEEAATCLGATRWQTFSRVILPTLTPALLTGFALAFARAIGEYGSVIFIAGNMPMVSEITPLIIIGQLEQYDYAGATAVATVMLLISFVLLLLINALQAWQRRRS